MERGAHLLHDEGHGRALVEQAQLAGLVLAVPWVPVDASVQQRPVEVTHQRPNVPE